MTRSLPLLTRSLLLTVLAGGACLSPVLSQQAWAADQSEAPSKVAIEKSSEEKDVTPAQHIERRINELHAKLKLTEQQEPLWETVATTMRTNETSMHSLIQERRQKEGHQSALEDLQSYQKIALEHAESLGKFILSFQPLYNSMNDEQKKNADGLFSSFEGRGTPHRHKKG